MQKTQKKYNFISGLPRSGTTLFSAILNQNPRFTASISGPLARFSRAVIEESSSQGGYRFQCPEPKRKEIIKSIFDTYYSDSNAEVCFDTNRGWTLLLPLLKDLYPESKVIVFVRDIEWIIDSFEQLVQKQPYTVTSMFPTECTNSYQRAQYLMEQTSPLGFAYMALKHMLAQTQYKDQVMLVEYNDLAKYPEKIMKEVYKFIGEEYFEHDFENVEYTNDEFDNDIALANLHTTRKKVQYIERETILPKDLFEHFKGSAVWRK